MHVNGTVSMFGRGGRKDGWIEFFYFHTYIRGRGGSVEILDLGSDGLLR